jgi:transposase
MTDGRGVPVAVVLTGANVHDKWALEPTLDAVPIRAGGGVRRPTHLCLDKGYDYADCDDIVRARGIQPHIRRRGEKKMLGTFRGKARRWVVERTNSWHNRFRGLLIRWETKAANYLALVQLACAIIAFRQTLR